MSNNLDKSKVPASLVKELRDISGAGMSDCRNALISASGDLEEARSILRKNGIIKAEKKSSRISSEGLISIQEKDNNIAIIEVNSETDFVAKNALFQDLCSNIADLILKNNSDDVSYILSQPYSEDDKEFTINDKLIEAISSIGEKIVLRRVAMLSNSSGLLSHYIHSKISDNLGKIGVIISVNTNNKSNEIQDFTRKICMHIAASEVLALRRDDLPSDFLTKEHKVFSEQVLLSGKEGDLAEKIIQGKLNKRCEEVVLLDQPFIMDGKKKIKDVINDFEKEYNCQFSIVDFKKFIVGEGIEKVEDNFVEEVQKLSTQF